MGVPVAAKSLDGGIRRQIAGLGGEVLGDRTLGVRLPSPSSMRVAVSSMQARAASSRTA